MLENHWDDDVKTTKSVSNSRSLQMGPSLINYKDLQQQKQDTITGFEKQEEIPVVAFPPTPNVSDWFRDIDTNRPASCGVFKCMVESIMKNDNNSTQMGYLIAQGYNGWKHKNMSQELREGMQQRWRKKTLRSMHRGYRKSQELANLFSIRHFLVYGPPEHQQLSDEDAIRMLNQLTRRKPSFQANSNNDSDTPPIIIQPTQIADHRSLFFGCHFSKLRTAHQQLEEWIGENSNSSKTRNTKHQSRTITYDDYQRNLLFDLNAIIKMLQSPEGKCLLNDFQVLIDPMMGQIYNFDVDRCYEGGLLEGESCLDALKKYSHDLLEWKRNATMATDTRIKEQ